MGEERKVNKVLVRNRKERDRSEDGGVDGRMGSEYIFLKIGWGGVWSGLNWLRIVVDGGLL
jgi:hypothetical protein